MNFRPNTTVTDNQGNNSGYLGSDNDQGVSCGINGYTDTGCFWFRTTDGSKAGIQSTQPFRAEAVAASDGQLYWHVLVGNSDDNWKQDTWIRMNSSN